MEVVLFAGPKNSHYPKGIHLTDESALYLHELLMEDDSSGKTALDHVIKDEVFGGYIVTLPRHHHRLVEVVKSFGVRAGHDACCPMVIRIPKQKYYIKTVDHLEFVCDPETKSQI